MRDEREENITMAVIRNRRKGDKREERRDCLSFDPTNL